MNLTMITCILPAYSPGDKEIRIDAEHSEFVIVSIIDGPNTLTVRARYEDLKSALKAINAARKGG